VAVGLDPSGFWDLTPREVLLHLQGARDRREYEHNENIALAWHVESFRRAKKLPSLASVLQKPGASRRQSAADVAALLSNW